MMETDSSPNVILIAGPAGAGKTTIAKRIGNEPGWVALSEDEFWNRLPREPHTFRTDVEKAIVQGMVADAAIELLERGERVAIEFIVYEDPPQPIQFYVTILAEAGYQVAVRVLRPSVAALLDRQAKRGNSHDMEVSVDIRRGFAEHQVRCLNSQAIDAKWVIDASELNVDELYAMHFAPLLAQA
ncbi:MAG: AAA family ATPase [Armatimonadaceae bacterium]